MTADAFNTTYDAPIRWAISATGAIAHSFACDIAHAQGAHLVAVGSRSPEAARAFGASFGDIRAHGDLAALAADPAIDAVYIASPNSAHLAQASALMRAGKHVLVEKPLAVSVSEARALVAVAADTGRFAMEGLWTLFLPAIDALRAALEDGTLGRIVSVSAELAYAKPFDAASRFFAPSLGGGSALDMGIYPIALTLSLFGTPETVTGAWHAAPTGVDDEARFRLGYGGFAAELACGFRRDGANRYVIRGERATLVVDAPFLKAARLIRLEGGRGEGLLAPGPGRGASLLARVARRLPLPGVTISDYGFAGAGLQFEIAAASAAIRAGRTEHPRMPLARSIEALEIIEAIRALPPS
ncbi:Gfo/Idh/MocA family protein [Ensifer soli]|uniref:Gfo/Idh/MocA family protein n=1 Tax=Ciceribacter sp. sgz301302 TaxID=3342379 RepID=UPI0035B76157